MSPDLERAIRAARAGAAAIRQFAGDPGDVRYKSPDQPVTEADLASNRAIRDILLPPGAGDGWISEENPEPALAERTWVVDPLDGTRNFVEGTSEYAICIALLVGGEPRLGVIHNPARGSVYYAERGRGAFRDGAPIQSRPMADPPLLAVSAKEPLRPAFAHAVEGQQTTTIGSTALKMASVAEGTADLYLSGTRKGIWDVCAGWVILSEAGGDAVALDGPFQWEVGRSVDGTLAWGPGAESTARALADRLIAARESNRQEEA